MRWIDRYAYGNRIRRLNPAYKAGFSLFVMLICLVLNDPLICAIALLIVLGLAVFWAGLPTSFFLKVLLTEGSFLLIGVLGVAISLSTSSLAGGFKIGFLWFLVTPDSLMNAIELFARSLSCTAALNFLAFTTPLVDLVDLLRRLKVSDIIIDLMALIYRFIFTLMDSFERMLHAQEVRLGFNGWRNSLNSAAQIATNLFIESFRRSKQLEKALQGRGWDGHLNVLPQEYQSLHTHFMKGN